MNNVCVCWLALPKFAKLEVVPADSEVLPPDLQQRVFHVSRTLTSNPLLIAR